MDSDLLDFADRLASTMPVFAKAFLKHQISDIYKGKITPVQFVVLDFLNKQGESKMKEIATFMGVSMATTTGVVERLVRDGYAQRLNDAKDRRIVRARLTVKGRTFIQKIYQKRREMIINLFGKVSRQDRESYLRILTKIKEILITEEQV